jgi:hypothetical protein
MKAKVCPHPSCPCQRGFIGGGKNLVVFFRVHEKHERKCSHGHRLYTVNVGQRDVLQHTDGGQSVLLRLRRNRRLDAG